MRFVRASCGRSHTVCVDAEGRAWAFGGNKCGQLGIGSIKGKKGAKPSDIGDTRPDATECAIDAAAYGRVADVACGGDFTLWLTEAGKVLSAGHPQHGALGHGTDHEYNQSVARINLGYEPQPSPRPIRGFGDKKIVRIACGVSHSIAVDEDGGVWTWGCGDYGRLGHNEQKDEFAPRRIRMFADRMACPTDYGVASAGSTWSAVTGAAGQLYVWGKLKLTGDTQMYPLAFMDLSGWNIRDMASGNMINVVAAESSCIAWGTSQGYGELGYGAGGPKSSANPRKVDQLEGKKVLKVGAGLVSYAVIVDMSAEDAKKEFPTVDTLPNGAAAAAAAEPASKGIKRKAAPGRGRGRGAKAGRGGRGGRGTK